ncbi:ParB/RepB/Spo0J family partition protein [Brachybacterium sp. AOP29-B2-41]|uniref:ParB/RepB/Spo0J family partition protein n=1 Tax=Brachybacterium sp. AOP29-B2-41 TaxID=3457704 RepID=UPI004034A6F0
MTQKRGLGRGLGALIPGAGSRPAPEQELRTRTRPSDATEGRSSSPRPVDMFFSGEKVGETERAQRGSAGAHDLATGMARAAAERRGRTNGSGAARSGAASTKSKGADEEPQKESSNTSTSTRSSRSTSSSSGTAKKAAPKSTAAKAPAPKRAAAKSTAAKNSAPTKATEAEPAVAAAKNAGAAASPTAETKKPSASSSTTAKRTTSKPAASEAASSKPASAKSSPAKATSESTAEPAGTATTSPRETTPRQSEDSPVVDVETVTSTPAQPDAPAPAPAEEPTDLPPEPTDTAEDSEDAAPESEPANSEDDIAQDESGSDAPPTELTGTRGLVSVPGAEFAEIPIHEVRENPRNPRTMFDDDELDELAYSLREVGVLQPVVVRPIPVTEDGESFELVMGERRWRAARRAGLLAIPAIIRETSDDDLLRDALLENLHRTQLNPLEEANAYQQLLEDFGCTQDELGERIGRSRPQITNTLRLLRLPALVQRRLASGAISAGHARALLSLDSPTLMEELAQRIVQEGLSVRAVERLVARGGQETGTRTVRRTTYDPHVVDLTSRLSNRLEAPVRIDVGKRKGRITLEFSNLEDLERLVENMGLDIPLPDGEHAAQD